MQMQNKIMKESHILTFQNTSYSAVEGKGDREGYTKDFKCFWSFFSLFKKLFSKLGKMLRFVKVG